MNWEDIVTEPDRLDRWLHQRLAGFSMARVRELLAAGRVRVNDLPAKKGLALRVEDVVVVEGLPKGPLPPADEGVELAVVLEDARVAVVDKPAGMATQPLSPEERGSLLNAALGRWPDLRAAGGNPLEPGLIHRLDTKTTGLVLFAKDPEAFAFLKHELRMRRMEKHYRALVWGRPQPEEGEIKVHLAHHPTDPGLMAPAVAGVKLRGEPRPALTRYRVLENHQGVSLLELRLVTGVMHQLRVHLAFIGHPVLGDDRYGDRPEPESPAYALQAARLAFSHPDDRGRVEARVKRELVLSDRNRWRA